MKGLRSIPRILKINNIDGYLVSCLFNNGESRIIDFKDLFENVFKIKGNDPALELLEDYNTFKQIEIIENTVGWPNIGFYSEDENGEQVFYHYDLDPIVLYQNSKLDKERSLIIGLMIKQARKEEGLTQQELAERSGTSKHYISRIENNKSDIEMLTLKKIVEAGLGRKLRVQIN
ncbi:helix-turn-helix domain-containing protein [Flavilitoribacter nigricans]|nr:helix-turn-helix transcriptional regulator [Flavilitoribacter nigricans]